MKREEMREAVRAVRGALVAPEEFAGRWETGEARYPLRVWVALLGTAALGTASYGMTMGILGGVSEILRCAVLFTITAGLAWLVPVPAIYILNSFGGSGLTFGGTALAVGVTVSWGGLAMIASIPVNWFFTVAVPVPWFVEIVNVVIFTGVGVAMIDVFGRVIARLEPERGRLPARYLVLVAAIGIELFFAFDLFRFAVGEV